MKSMLTSLIAIILTAQIYAQADSTVASADTTHPKSTLTLGLSYANSASYYGQKSEENTAYGAVAASYRFKGGFYFSGLAYRLIKDSNSLISAASLGAGYEVKLGKKLSADLSYSHSFFASYSPLLQAGNAENASLALNYTKWMTFTLTGDYAFGKANDEFITAELSKSINLFSLGKKDIITINPSVNVASGTQHFYQTYLTEKNLRDSLLGLISPVLGNPSTPDGGTTATTTAFNVLSYSFKFPLAYNRASYLVEADYQLSALSNKAQSNPGKLSSFLSVSFYYQF
jgi:hypothetical protein